LKKINNKLLNVIKIIWVIAVVAGGAYYIVKNYTTAIHYLSTISVWKLILSFLLIFIMRILNVDLVQQSLVLIGWKPNFKEAFSFVSLSQLGKYIPGGVWQFVARFGAYKENQIAYKDMGKAFVVENIWVVIGASLVSMFFIFISKADAIYQKFNLTISPILQAVLAVICLLLWIGLLIGIELFFKSEVHKPGLKNVLKQFVSQTAMWIIFGLSFFCLFSRTGTLNDLFFTIGAFGLSFVAGYVVIISPGGIGVREYVAVILFALMFSSTEIGIYTIVHRLLYTVAEFLAAGIALLISKKNKKTQNEINPSTAGSAN